MLKCRYFVMLLLIAVPTTSSMGQNLLDGLRQRMQNRALCGSCECGASTPTACTCQDCGSCSAARNSRGYQTPNVFLPSNSPSTGGTMPADGYGQSVLGGAGTLPNLPTGQPDYFGASPDTTGQFADPNSANSLPPNFNPSDPNAGFSGMDGNGIPPAAVAAAGGNGAAAGQDADEGFGLSNQFAAQGEASGVQDLTIGDFFSGSGAVVQGGNAPFTIPIAGGDRRRKVSDHFSPIPVNRTFFSYHGFGDATTDVNGTATDVQRFTFGLERTFWNNNASFEVRLPFQHGVSSSQVEGVDPTSSATATEFGNITLATKYLLLRQRNYSVSAGVASVWPTASDAELVLNTGTLHFQNDAYDIIPFLAYNFKPNKNSWATLTTQLDFNVRGNEVIADQGTVGEQSGIYNDQSLYSIDLSTGRWFWKEPCCSNRMMRGLAGIFELHYTTTMNDTDEVDLGSSTITNPFNRTDTLNSTVGFRFLLGERTYATFAGVFPLRTVEDRPFETEFNFNLSRLY